MRPYPDVPVWMRPTDWVLHYNIGNQKSWDLIEIDDMIEMKREGLQYEDIARRLNRSPASVKCKYMKLMGVEDAEIMPDM